MPICAPRAAGVQHMHVHTCSPGHTQHPIAASPPTAAHPPLLPSKYLHLWHSQSTETALEGNTVHKRGPEMVVEGELFPLPCSQDAQAAAHNPVPAPFSCTPHWPTHLHAMKETKRDPRCRTGTQAGPDPDCTPRSQLAISIPSKAAAKSELSHLNSVLICIFHGVPRKFFQSRSEF